MLPFLLPFAGLGSLIGSAATGIGSLLTTGALGGAGAAAGAAGAGLAGAAGAGAAGAGLGSVLPGAAAAGAAGAGATGTTLGAVLGAPGAATTAALGAGAFPAAPLAGAAAAAPAAGGVLGGLGGMLTPTNLIGGAMIADGLGLFNKGGGGSGEDDSGPSGDQVGGPASDQTTHMPTDSEIENGNGGEFDYFRGKTSFAEGGEVPNVNEVDRPDGDAENEIIKGAVAAIEGAHPNPEMAIELFLENFGADAFEDLAAEVEARRRMLTEPDNAPVPGEEVTDDSGLGSLIKGGIIKGEGDGMSDSIPATIDGVAPARIATDEHIIPADVVSHLGNGSSDAGHSILKQMTESVRGARTGTPKQAPRIEPREFVPALAFGRE